MLDPKKLEVIIAALDMAEFYHVGRSGNPHVAADPDWQKAHIDRAARYAETKDEVIHLLDALNKLSK